MRINRTLLASLVVLLAVPCLSAQEAEVKEKKDKATTVVKDEPSEVPLKVQVVLTEFDGTQKISSFPYTLSILGAGPHERHDAHLRYGVKIPVSIGMVAGATSQITYEDVGTNIDCHAWTVGDGQYRLEFSIARSSVSMPNSNGKATEWKPGDTNPSSQPLIRSFRDDFIVVVRNGQTIEGTSAVDPITGHVQKVEVTLNVLK